MTQRALIPLIAILAATLISGCAATDPVSTGSEPTAVEDSTGTTEQSVVATTTGASTESPATVGVASTAKESEVVTEPSPSEGAEDEVAVAPTPAQPESAPFIADPRARGGDGYGADNILGVRYGIHDGYERVVIDLGAGNQPAGSVPAWTLSSPTGDGVLRITVPSVSSTRVSDGTFSGPLLKDFHVVRAPEDGMFVDIFSESAFTYRVLELLNPARLVVDFKPSTASLEFPLPAENASTVLAEPRRGSQVSGSLTVSGYSRNQEANNTIVLVDSSGAELVRDNVMSNDWTTTWGYFETTIDSPPFSGRATLKVGAESARDGTFEGVEIPVHGAQ
ncbi:hypothetical protein BH23ACT11_BH23ACT11_23030 [soil metagenome]